MSDAPETIWATPYDVDCDTGTYCPPRPHMDGGPPNGDATQYTRTDTIGWQPIETARDSLADNHSRLIWCPENRCTYAATWRDGEDGDKKGWHTFGGRWCSDAQNPSHWRPLPSPPEQEDK